MTEISREDIIQIIPATVDINTNKLNLKSKGKWVTAKIGLPEGYDENDIDVSTIMLEGDIPASTLRKLNKDSL